jgi:hypothetical protein
MTQAPTPKSATTPLLPSQPTSESQTTLWKTLEEGLRIQLTKHLAELIRRVQQSPKSVEGERNEFH